MKRFEKKYRVSEETNCWDWIAATDKDGYGVFYYNGRNLKAHRFSYEYFVGVIPEGKLVCHHCDNPGCVNPSHLFIGTDKDNMQDCIKKGRKSKIVAIGESHGSAKLTESQVLEMRSRIANGELTQYRAAKLYGVDSSLVNGIVHKRYWKHI